MTLDDLLTKYQKIHSYFQQTYPDIQGDYEILARLSKIAEEYGELVEATHSKLNLQRQTKVPSSQEDLEAEWADMFNTLMLFGIVMNINADSALKKKFKSLSQRYGLNLGE